ncbi:MAG: FAD-binding oxidoreductase [Bacteroidales bacterium]|nr:FAD-binding oxidoreductase [Bacteroidales bacterium]
MASYRDIFKWGDKKETSLDDGIKKVIKEKFNWSDNELIFNHNDGNEPIDIPRKCKLSDTIINEFISICGIENVSTKDADRALHSYGKHYLELLKLRLNKIENPPDAVIYPRNEFEIEKIISICNENKIAVVPFGGGSSVTCALQMPLGGVSLDLSKHLNKVIKINEENHSVTVEAGIFGPELEKALNAYSTGYTCGHFPQSFEFSTVGGWVAARGAGTLSTGYGKIEEILLSLEVVCPNGKIITEDYPADAQALDLNHIFLGSEGVFGVITKVCLKIRKFRPQNTAHASFIFKSFESAVSAMRTTMQAGYGKPHLYRISDPEETDVAFKLKGFDGSFSDKFLKLIGYQPDKRVLMFSAIEGDKKYTRFVKSRLKKACRKHKGFYIGSSPTKKWLEQRYSSAYSRDPLMDKAIITDTIETSVNWDNLVNLWKSVHTYLKSRPLTVSMMHISHVYENGANLYITFLSPCEKNNEIEDYIQLHKGLVDTILANKGSLSHHHGIGRILAPWMAQKYGPLELDLLQSIKNKLDPNNIMNPQNMLGLK